MRTWKLQPSTRFRPTPGPLVIVVMDGVGIGPENLGNAVHLARTPVLDSLAREHPMLALGAHGTLVGLPSDEDMGNSEVGHNALGAGRVFPQGARLVNEAIASGALFRGRTWEELVARTRKGAGALHLIGLLSDGNVHSHIDHLLALIDRADQEGVARLFVHILLDGRDVPKTSALEYVDRLEAHLGQIGGRSDRNYRIASGGGRMLVTMDRYEADWKIVERGFNAHVHGEAEAFPSARAAIETFRARDPEANDQFLPPFVIAADGAPVGRIRDGDSAILFNFRGDRAIEISRAFEDDDFPHFDRKHRPKVLYAGMMQYDGDFQIPKHYLVSPPAIEGTMGEFLARNEIPQFACSETQKFGHVTYFWNGNRGGKFSETLETYVEVPSDLVPFSERPWMKAAEITDATLEAIRSNRYRLIRVNFANGDMVGHTGKLDATILGVEAVDLCLGRLLAAVRAARGIALVTADHGNADEMLYWDKKTQDFKRDAQGNPEPKTSHSLNPVPFYLFDPEGAGLSLRHDIERPGLANVAATALNLLGFEAPEGYEPSLLASSRSIVQA